MKECALKSSALFFMEKIMTIANNYVPIKQAGNGNTKSFTFSFRLLADDYLVVFQEINNIQTVVSEDDYTVNMEEVGGTVDFKTAPAAGTYIIITRNVPLDQLTPYRTSSGFPADRVEENLDKLTAITQQLSEGLDRVPKLPVGTTGVDVTLPLPDAGKAIIWNEEGNGFENSTANFDEVIEDATEQANIATQKANEAAQSASSASASATAAENSADKAQAAASDAQDIKDSALTEITAVKDEAIAEINKFEIESATVIMSGSGSYNVSLWYQSADVDGYPYKCDSAIPYTFDSSKNYSLSGYTTLSVKDATSGNIAPIAGFEKNSTNDYVYVSLYAKEKPTENVTTLSTVVFIKEI